MTLATLETAATPTQVPAGTSVLVVDAGGEQQRALELALEGTAAIVARVPVPAARWTDADSADVAADVVVLFASRPRSATVRAVKRIASSLPETPVIVIAADGGDALTRATIKAGATAVVLETELGPTLPVAIGAALAGMICVPRALRRHVERHVLSNREKQVLALVVMHYSNAEIAAQLFLAESTVKTHLSSIFMKLGVRSRHEAAALVLDPEEGVGLGVLALSDAAAARPIESGAA